MSELEPILDDEDPAHLRDDVLLPLLEEVGACGDLHRAAAVCKCWAATAAQLWPVVVERWNATLQNDLRCSTRESATTPLVKTTQQVIVHDKSRKELRVGTNLHLLRADPVKVVTAADGVVYVQWVELKIVNDNGRFRQQVVDQRRPVALFWTGIWRWYEMVSGPGDLDRCGADLRWTEEVMLCPAVSELENRIRLSQIARQPG